MASPLQEVRIAKIMWAGLNGFDPRNKLALGGVRIGICCMNLVTVISRVPVTLSNRTVPSTQVAHGN